MSFLAGRLAATEGAFFLQESKLAVARLAEKSKSKLQISQSSPAISSSTSSSSSSSSSSLVENQELSADVLPEVLKHNLPPKIFQYSESASNSSSYFANSKWIVQNDAKNNPTRIGSAEALNPLRAYVSLPQATFGPRRWQVPNAQNSSLASTANDLRLDKHTPVNPEKMKAVAAGLSQIGIAFACATTIIFGGSILTFHLLASKLELQKVDDIKTKGKDIIHPKFETVREKLAPLRTWVENRSKKWRMEKEQNLKENPLIKELSKALGAKTSN